MIEVSQFDALVRTINAHGIDNVTLSRDFIEELIRAHHNEVAEAKVLKARQQIALAIPKGLLFVDNTTYRAFVDGANHMRGKFRIALGGKED